MLPIDAVKVQQLLEALEEANILLRRAQLTCEQAEKVLKIRLNERFQVVD